LRNAVNAAKLYLEIEKNRPDIVLVTETWLDDATEVVSIPGYRSIARRDRSGKKKGGGVDIFVRNGYWNAGLHSISETSERSWVTLHTELGPLLIGVWYRPPDEAPEELASLTEELEKHSIGHIGTFLCCDANVHQKKWLKYSDGNTSLGQNLQDICSDAGLTQIVREPTPKENLLDLIMTSMPESSKATVVGSVSDHRAVFCATNIDVPQIVEVEREVWNFRDADWDGLRGALRKRDWDYIKTSDVDEGAASLAHDILDAAKTLSQRGS